MKERNNYNQSFTWARASLILR